MSGVFFFFSSRRRHTRLQGDWSSDVCSSDLARNLVALLDRELPTHLALGPRLAVSPHGPVARDEEQGADPHRSDVVRDGRGRLRQRDVLLFQMRFCAHVGRSSSSVMTAAPSSWHTTPCPSNQDRPRRPTLRRSSCCATAPLGGSTSS